MKKSLIAILVILVLAVVAYLFSIGLFTGNAVWGWDWCAPDRQCPNGEGDCDTGADCLSGYCAENKGNDYGVNRGLDVCECPKGTIWDGFKCA